MSVTVYIAVLIKTKIGDSQANHLNHTATTHRHMSIKKLNTWKL